MARSRRSLFSCALAAFLSAVAAAGSAEITFRLKGYLEDGRSGRDPWALPRGAPDAGGSARLGQVIRISSNPRIVYELIPNLNVTFLSAPLMTNSEDFRGPAVPLAHSARAVPERIMRSASGMNSYYERRAREYDDWYTGAGLFAQRERPGWEAERDRLVRLVADLPPARVLDVGCGTGYLTRHLRGGVFGLDRSAAMLEMARAQAPGVRLLRADGLALPFPDASFDRIFAAHFYGHLLPDERALFLDEALWVARELVVVDAGPRGGPPREEWQERVLGDGSRHRVYKRFFTGESLAAELGGGRILHEGPWFVVVAPRSGASPARAASTADGWGD